MLRVLIHLFQCKLHFGFPPAATPMETVTRQWPVSFAIPLDDHSFFTYLRQFLGAGAPGSQNRSKSTIFWRIGVYFWKLGRQGAQMLQNRPFFKNWRLFLAAGALGNSNGPKSTILCVPEIFLGVGAPGNQNGSKSIIFTYWRLSLELGR